MEQNKMMHSELNQKAPVGEISETSQKASVEFLNILLANEYALFTKTLNFHWNVTGPRFHSLHGFLEEQYRSLLDVMDDVAERVRVLGHRPLSTVREMNNNNDLEEKTSKRVQSSDQMIQELLHDHMLIQEQLRKFLDGDKNLERDFGTEDFLVGLLQKHEMTSWMLKSHIEKH